MNIIHPSSIVGNLELTAEIPLEMVNAQQQLVTWCDLKLNGLRYEEKELEGAVSHAKKMKWKASTLISQHGRSIKRISFYEKIKSALLEGYYIVPNFPIQMFAIKTKKKSPERKYTTNRWDNKRQDSQELKIGIGEYQNPLPVIRQNSRTVEGKEVYNYWADDWDEFEFPVTMARPKIMEATTRAMALKIFDQIGIMPATKNDDPVIIGQITKKEGYNTKTVSFMIAWHLNTKVL